MSHKPCPVERDRGRREMLVLGAFVAQKQVEKCVRNNEEDTKFKQKKHTETLSDCHESSFNSNIILLLDQAWRGCPPKTLKKTKRNPKKPMPNS
jgi:hypothetical protein